MASGGRRSSNSPLRRRSSSCSSSRSSISAGPSTRTISSRKRRDWERAGRSSTPPRPHRTAPRPAVRARPKSSITSRRRPLSLPRSLPRRSRSVGHLRTVRSLHAPANRVLAVGSTSNCNIRSSSRCCRSRRARSPAARRWRFQRSIRDLTAHANVAASGCEAFGTPANRARGGDMHSQQSAGGPTSIRPPFTEETARAKVKAAQDGWNTRDPERVALAYSENSEWRNRDEFFSGREAIKAFLRRKWARELDYRLRKELWSFTGNRISVKFEYESHDAAGQWWRSYGNEQWEFDDDGLMRRREAKINDLKIDAADRRIT